jgi:hypothetical protein
MDTNVSSTQKLVRLQTKGDQDNTFIDQDGNGRGIYIDSEATSASPLRIDANNSSGAVLDLNSTMTSSSSAVYFDVENKSRGQTFDIAHNVTNANDGSGGSFRYVFTHIVNDGATRTKTGNVFEITSQVTETSGTVTDSAKVLVIKQLHSDASGNVVDIDNRGAGKGLVVKNNSTEHFSIDSSGSAVFAQDVTVPDEAYGAGWNGSFEVPTKNAVYDKIETISGGTVSASPDYVTNFLFMGA